MKAGTFSVRELFTYLDPYSWRKVALALGTTDTALDDYIRTSIPRSELIVQESILGRVKESPYSNKPVRPTSLVTMTVKFPWQNAMHSLQFEVECKGFQRFTCRFVQKKEIR